MSAVKPVEETLSGSRFLASGAHWRNAVEAMIPRLFFVLALVSVLTTIGIIFTLLFETASFFKDVSLIRFLTEKEWTALFSGEQQKFGIQPLVAGTLL